jgi:hypothetical protein
MPFRASSRASSVCMAVCTVASVLLAACGGAADSGLFDGPGGASPDAGSAGDDTNTPVDSGTPSHPGHDSGGSPIHDAAPSGANDANPEVDSAPQPTSAAIDCNVSGSIQSCDAATLVCCRTTSGNGNGNASTTFACTPPSGCGQQSELAIPCDNSDDCAAQGFPGGTVCCVTEDNNGVAASVACVAQSACSAQTQTTLCNGTNACPAGETCATSTMTIPGYQICRP